MNLLKVKTALSSDAVSALKRRLILTFCLLNDLFKRRIIKHL